jgi:hypothetical protein
MPERDAKGHFIKKTVTAVPVKTVSAELDRVEAGATPTLPILVAVNAALAQIRYNHPEVPRITIVLGAQGATRRGQVHGHFAPGSWADENATHEIMLSGESLARGAVATLGTLLHESAHAIAHVRGVKDTSNSGRYHNKKFKAIGEEVGIELEDAPTLGWSLTTVPESTQERYADEIAALTEVLTTYRRPPAPKEKKARKTTKFVIQCECVDNEVTVSKQWFAKNEHTLFCETCGINFAPVPGQDNDDDDNEED